MPRDKFNRYEYNPISHFLKTRWPLFVVITCFTLLKIQHRVIPFYWDESWPYAVAVKQMYHNGLSLLPNAIEPQLSRGHPLFFHVACAAWMHIFGLSNLSLHCFSLTISLLFLFIIYESALYFFSLRAAVLTVLLVATHISFFVQSSFILFEILVSFLSFFSIYLYCRGRYLAATFTLAAVSLTKESGAIAVFVIGLDGLIRMAEKGTPWRLRTLRLTPAIVATTAIGAFFVMQKQITGWFVLPLYTETLRVHWSEIWRAFGPGILNSTFNEDYEWLIPVALMVLSVAAYLRTRNRALLSALLFAPMLLLAFFMLGERLLPVTDNNPGQVAATLSVAITFVGIYVAVLFMWSSPNTFPEFSSRRFIRLCGLFTLAFMFFSSFTYYSARYLLVASVPGLYLLGVYLDSLLRPLQPIYTVFVLVLICGCTWFAIGKSTSWGDNSLGFMDGVRIEMRVVEYLEQHNCYDKIIVTNSFLQNEQLTDQATGALHWGHSFSHVSFVWDKNTDLVILENIDNPETKPYSWSIYPDFRLVQRFTEHGRFAEIYARR